ncbi:MerR family transcriptional regulator [candidate division KSB1 bacterium]|nr:MerR family transcriptional regulator [candidate division KSB1 bacterium]
MQLNQFILSAIDKEELREWITSAVADEFEKKVEPSNNIPDEVLLTRKEVAKLYHTSFVTLRQWEKVGIIPRPIRKGTRVFFRKSDVLNDIRKRG